jgi:hypothetical protein
MTKQEYNEIIDMLEGAGFEAQKIECAEFTGNVSRVPSYWVRFQRKSELEKERQEGVNA